MSKEEIISLLRLYKEKNHYRYGITALGVFGSFAKNKSNVQSDLDIVIEIVKPDLFTLADIKQDLELQTGLKVDIVRNRATMNTYLKKHIQEEAFYV